MGISWNDFWKMNPRIINLHIKGHNEKMKERDEWVHTWVGTYVLSAASVAVEHNLHGKNAKSGYVEKAVTQTISEREQEENLTEEEIYQRELEKALFAEEQWIKAAEQKGLPETII